MTITNKTNQVALLKAKAAAHLLADFPVSPLSLDHNQGLGVLLVSLRQLPLQLLDDRVLVLHTTKPLF